MRPDHVSIVRSTWSALAPREDEIVAEFYVRLFDLAPDTRAMFAHVDMAAQRKKFGEMVAAMVQLADGPEDIVITLGPTARRHVAYGVTDDHLVAGREALAGALAHALGESFTPNVRQAWCELYDLAAALIARASTRVAVQHEPSRAP